MSKQKQRDQVDIVVKGEGDRSGWRWKGRFRGPAWAFVLFAFGVNVGFAAGVGFTVLVFGSSPGAVGVPSVDPNPKVGLQGFTNY